MCGCSSAGHTIDGFTEPHLRLRRRQAGPKFVEPGALSSTQQPAFRPRSLRISSYASLAELRPTRVPCSTQRGCWRAALCGESGKTPILRSALDDADGAQHALLNPKRTPTLPVRLRRR